MNEHLEIYKVFVETITANEMRRQTSSTIYLGMLSAIATITPTESWENALIPVAVAFVIALTWLVTVVYFRRLAQAKFAVIAEIEKELSLSAFNLEWQHFSRHNKYSSFNLTHLEMVIPTATMLACIAYVLYFVSLRVT